MEVRSIDAIVAMVLAGLGVSIVPEPRQALLEAHGVRALRPGRGVPLRTATTTSLDGKLRAGPVAFAGET